MHYVEVIRTFVELRNGAAVIFGPSKNSGLLYNEGHEPATIYNMELGYPAAIALGLALARPEQRVVAIEGDGSMTAAIGVLSTAARYDAPNLVVLIMDNNTYGSVGVGDTETASVGHMDFAGIARSSGWRAENIFEVTDIETFRQAISTALSEPGPWLIHAPTDRYTAESIANPPLPGQDIVESVIFFRRAMQARDTGAQD